jgi:quinoprotein glucose dehydrogenase
MLYVYSFTRIMPISLVPTDGKPSEMNFLNGQATDPKLAPPPPPPTTAVSAGPAPQDGPDRANAAEAGGGGPTLTVRGLPIVKPPYGRITAFDMNKGDLVWQVAHGDTPDAVKNHPALKGLTIPRTGRVGLVGTLVTKTLVIAGEPGVVITSNGKRGAMLRAYDKATGADAGAVYMPAPQSGSPMTYMLNGKQYIVIATSGGGASGELLAFKLPS